jgi:cellulose synthase/poly-beta-1,6-N-acetylglucosamine synthase-like glycosyltransferase
MNPSTPSVHRVSILVAARNEADNIVRCLRALDALNFPKNQLDIWIGNDLSTDTTEELVLNYIAGKPHYHYRLISEPWPGLKGKANVLAQLAREAQGDYFFFCDADIAVQPTWLHDMLRHFQKNVSVVVGVTRMTPTGGFAALQSLEWLVSLATMRFFSYGNIPFTGMGNNMAVTRKAYQATGGYEAIEFSIVEDYALFQAILSRGYAFVQAFRPGLVSVSEPAPTFPQLLQQRKRWVKGAMQAPLLIRLTFYASALFLPLLLGLILFFPKVTLALAGLHFLLVAGVAALTLLILHQPDLAWYIPVFWLYFLVINPLMLINYLLPAPVEWKGRTY